MSQPRIIRRPPAKAAPQKSSGGKGKWIASILILLFIAAGAWAFLPQSDPGLARIEELRGQMEGATDEQRRELFGKMREEYENLSPEAQEEARDGWRRRWEEREQKQLNEFFALTPAEQIAHLDEDLKRDEERRKEWEKRRAERQRDGGNADRGDRGGRGGRDRGQRGPGSDPNARRKSYLDHTPPQTRAMRSEYRRMREERRQKLGLPQRGRGR